MTKNILLLAFFSLFSCRIYAQNDSAKITISVQGEEYKRLEKHFSDKEKDKKRNTDRAKFYRYEALNDSLKKPVSVVFMGNSITERWARIRPDFFAQNGFVGRGIGGQTTSEMLVRFQADVVDLQPKIVVIMAGTNDLARNNGIISHKHILQNIQSMCELACFHQIKPILCSVLPAYKFGWNKELSPAAAIRALNEMIRNYAASNHIPYVDYYSLLVDERGGLPAHIAEDGVHPGAAGYEIMEPAVLKTIKSVE